MERMTKAEFLEAMLQEFFKDVPDLKVGDGSIICPSGFRYEAVPCNCNRENCRGWILRFDIGGTPGSYVSDAKYPVVVGVNPFH